MSKRRTSPGTRSAISSPGSGDGLTRSFSPGGIQLGLPGLGVAPANPFRAPESGEDTRTSGTSGRSSSASSRSVGLQLSLESRLRAALDVSGSPEYALTWSRWDMGSGPPICRLRASARRTSGNACSGWPTARAEDGREWSPNAPAESASGHGLGAAAQAAGWATPAATSAGGTAEQHLERKRKAVAAGSSMGIVVSSLDHQAELAGWATPKATDGMGGRTTETEGGGNVHLDRQARGTAPSGSPAPTGKRGALNPALSLWLQGFPDVWLSCGVRGIPFARKSRRRS